MRKKDNIKKKDNSISQKRVIHGKKLIAQPFGATKQLTGRPRISCINFGNS